MESIEMTTLGHRRPAIWNVTESPMSSLLEKVNCWCFRMSIALMMDDMADA